MKAPLPSICMIQGQHPQSAIYDYCQQLSCALEREAITCVFAPLPPNRGSLLSYLQSMLGFLRTQKQDTTLFHMHYPGWPLRLQFLCFPQLLMLYLFRKPVVTTIHDLTKFPSIIRLLYIPFFILSRQLIFANPMEQYAAQRVMAWFGYDLGAKSHIIPIGSSITQSSHIPPDASRKGVVYFGHIRSGKGIEFFLDTAEKMHQAGRSDPFTLIGNIETCDYLRFRYATSLLARVYHLSPELRIQLQQCRSSEEFAVIVGTLSLGEKILPNVTWLMNADESTCAATIASHRFALMPFTDGASMRRSSLQAVLLNRCITLTTWGKQTDDILKAITLQVTTPEDALQIFLREDDFKPLADAMKTHEARIDWNRIAAQHKHVFASLLGNEDV